MNPTTAIQFNELIPAELGQYQTGFKCGINQKPK